MREEARTRLARRLRSRHEEIEQAALTRVYAVSDPMEIADPEYKEGLPAAVSAALGYGIAAFECTEDRSPPTPTELLSQARLAARNRITLDAVMRRYIAGYTVFGDFLIEAAEEEGISSSSSLKALLRIQAALLDRLLSSVTDEYNREQGQHGSTTGRKAEQVRRLLVGELLDAPGLEYDFGAHHLGVIASGDRAAKNLHEALADLDCRSLLVPAGEEAAWAWLGARRRIDPGEVEARLRESSLRVAIGEPAKELSGWRLSHRQAQASMPIAQRGPERVVCYRDVALLASILGDDLLVTSLHQIFLGPLEKERDGGEAAKKTLRAYFAAARHVSSTAAALGINRNTVSKRLAAIERAIGRPLDSCGTELEAALRLEDLRGGSSAEPLAGRLRIGGRLSTLPPRKVT